MYPLLRVLLYASALMSSEIAVSGIQRPVPFHIDPAQSRVWFDADARLFSFRGQTQKITGGFMLWNTSPPQMTDAKVTIDASSLNTANTDRDADMRKDFLEVETFPAIEFTVIDLLIPRPVSAGAGWDLILQGRLTVHGVTREVKVPTTVHLTPTQIKVQGQIHLDMRDYNIRVPRLLLVPMKSEVLVGFEAVALAER